LGVGGEGPGAVVADDDLEEIGEGGDGELAGDVARTVPPHPVGDGHDAVFRHEEEAVLVVLPEEASVGHPGEPGLHGERVDAGRGPGASSKAAKEVRMDRFGNFVGGSFRTEGQALAVRSPFDGAPVAEVTLADAGTLDAAAEAAERAQPAMAALTREARAAILERGAEGGGARRDELARTLMHESGKPIAYARIEVARAVDTFRTSAAVARALAGEEIPLDAARPGEGRLAFTRRFPVGPVASITPFNFPLNLV